MRGGDGVNNKSTTLKQTTQRRMSEVGRIYKDRLFTARGMVSLLVEGGLSRTPITARVCMWLKVHPQFTTIRTSRELLFKYIGEEEE